MTNPPQMTKDPLDSVTDVAALVTVAKAARALVETNLAGLDIDSYMEDLDVELGQLGAWPRD